MREVNSKDGLKTEKIRTEDQRKITSLVVALLAFIGVLFIGIYEAIGRSYVSVGYLVLSLLLGVGVIGVLIVLRLADRLKK